MAKSMGRAAMATGNVSLMEKMDVTYTDGGTEEADANTLIAGGVNSGSPSTNESPDDFMQVIHLAESQIKV